MKSSCNASSPCMQAHHYKRWLPAADRLRPPRMLHQPSIHPQVNCVLFQATRRGNSETRRPAPHLHEVRASLHHPTLIPAVHATDDTIPENALLKKTPVRIADAEDTGPGLPGVLLRMSRAVHVTKWDTSPKYADLGSRTTAKDQHHVRSTQTVGAYQQTARPHSLYVFISRMAKPQQDYRCSRTQAPMSQ